MDWAGHPAPEARTRRRKLRHESAPGPGGGCAGIPGDLRGSDCRRLLHGADVVSSLVLFGTCHAGHPIARGITRARGTARCGVRWRRAGRAAGISGRSTRQRGSPAESDCAASSRGRAGCAAATPASLAVRDWADRLAGHPGATHPLPRAGGLVRGSWRRRVVGAATARPRVRGHPGGGTAIPRLGRRVSRPGHGGATRRQPPGGGIRGHTHTPLTVSASRSESVALNAMDGDRYSPGHGSPRRGHR